MARSSLRGIPLVLALFVVLFAAPGRAADDELARENSPSFSERTAGTQALEGFLDLYWDAETGALLLSVDRFDEPLLYLTSLARGLGSNDLFLDRGQLGATRLVRFQRSGPKILLVEDNVRYVAHSDDPLERRAVEESFARSVLWGFEAVAEGDGRVLVDATEFFLQDAHDLARKLRVAGEGSFEIDPSRSAIHLPRTRSFPDNTEVEALITWTGGPEGPHLPTVVPDASSVSAHLHHSFIRLPEPGFEPVRYDGRSGYSNSVGLEALGIFQDYATAVGDPLRGSWLPRHRLQKKDPSAEVSEAVEPIVYYVDSGVPEPIRSALVEGASWWAEAFETAGYRDAFRVALLPDGVDPMDIRYNVIQWVHRSTRGWSYGLTVTDPRTGEILKGQVSLGSLRVRQDYLLAEGLLSPYGMAEVPDELLEFALARIRQLSAHEVGHTLGISHNFAASADGRSSVMDYPFPLVRLDAKGEIDLSEAYGVGVGEWDERTILYGYQDFPKNVDADAAREEILRGTHSRGLRFVADDHSRTDEWSVNAGPAHPLGNLWDNGDDAVTELDRLMEVRSVVLKRFSERAIRLGRPMATLEDVLVPMYLLHRYQILAAATFVGGQEFTYSERGDGWTPVRTVPSARQREAIAALLRTITPDALRLPPELVALIPPRTPGSLPSRELFPRRTGYVFDPEAAVASAAELTLSAVLDPTRAARMNNNHALDSDQPGFAELIDRVLDATVRGEPVPGRDGRIRRTVDHVVLARLLSLVARPTLQPEARAVLLDRLVELRTALDARAAGAEPAWRAHYRFGSDQIRRFLEDPSGVPPSRPVDPPPGSPI